MALGCGLTGYKSVAKNYDGIITIDVPEGQKVIEATWKDNDV